MIKATVKRHVVHYYKAVLDDGEEITLSADDVLRYALQDGQEISGVVEEYNKQMRYADGSWSRTYVHEKRFEIQS